MARLKELERERQFVEADKAQVDRYKKLLLKQRDIMIALTARLNERDEQIITLQVLVQQFLQRAVKHWYYMISAKQGIKCFDQGSIHQHRQIFIPVKKEGPTINSYSIHM